MQNGQKMNEKNVAWVNSIPAKLLRGKGVRTHVVGMSCIENGQGIAAPVSHQLHPRSCLLNVEPELTDSRGDVKQPGIGQGFDNADYKTCIGPPKPSCVVCTRASTHFGNVFVQLVLGHIHRSQVYDTDNRRIRGELDITRKFGKPWHPGTGPVMVVDLITVYGSIAVGVGTFDGYQCPVCVGVVVLGASEECDSDVNIRLRKAQTLRVHINWKKGVRALRGSEEESYAQGTHGTGGTIVD